MATDILGRRPQTVKQAYSSDQMIVVLAGINKAAMLVQNAGISYGQAVTRMFDLEDPNFQAYVAARPQGQLTLNNIVTDVDGLKTFTQTYGDVCQSGSESKTMLITVGDNSGQSCGIKSGTISLSQPVLVNMALSISVADYIVNNNMGFLFASAQ